MAAKAMVPAEAIPCINRFRGHGPLLRHRRLDHGWSMRHELQERPMATKAMVPAEAFPCIDRFRGHGPLLPHRRLNHG